MMSAQMKLLPKGRERISVSEKGHRQEVVESGSAVGKEVRHGVEHRLLNCFRCSAVQITASWR
jgi:hypothetical protein